MISVHCGTNEAVRRYGLQHFLNKFGIEDGKSNIALVFGDAKADEQFTVRVLKNEMSEQLEGAVHYKDDAIPLFETPQDAGTKGTVVATYSNGVDEKRISKA